ncbi:MAG: hypothetical protein AB8F95_11290 [Bacteroidia bacterium]
MFRLCIFAICLFCVSFTTDHPPFVIIKAKKIGDDVHVSWRVDPEKGPHDYIIQRSLDNSDFQAISFIEGDGERMSANTFEYVDVNVVAHDSDILFYRVVAVDHKGINKPSEVTTISQQQSLGLIVDYFRIPEKPQALFVAYRANGEGDLYLQVFSPSGASIYYKQVPNGPGFRVVEIALAQQTAGTFRLQLFDDLYAVEKDAIL